MVPLGVRGMLCRIGLTAKEVLQQSTSWFIIIIIIIIIFTLPAQAGLWAA
jgi:hypothetical protein